VLSISKAHLPSRSFVIFSSPTFDSHMPPSATESRSEPSTVRLPQPIQTQSTDPIDLLDKTQTPPSADPGTYDPSVVPPSHNSRTIVMCFDGTGDQIGEDVCAISCSQCLSHRPNLSHRIQTSFSSFRCSRRMTRVSRWLTIRSSTEADCSSL
jgi:hypothetical protein